VLLSILELGLVPLLGRWEAGAIARPCLG